MRNELLLVLCLAPLVSGCGGDGAQAQELGAATVPVLKAASGKTVGVLMDVAGNEADEMRVLQVINSRATVIVIGAAGGDGTRGIQGESLHYASGDCTGTPYSTVRGLVTNKLTARRLGRWYVADREAEKQNFAYASRSIGDDCLATGGVGLGAPAIELSPDQSAAIDGYEGPYEAWLVPAAELPVL